MLPPLIASTPSAAAVALTSATPANVTSLPLSKGTYLVWGQIDAALAGATLTALTASLSLTSSSLSSQQGQNVGGAQLGAEAIAQAVKNLTGATGTESLPMSPTVALIPAGGATLYVVGQATFSAGSVSAYGSLFAMPVPG